MTAPLFPQPSVEAATQVAGRCPVPWQRVVHIGSQAEAAWSEWLAARDLPCLATLGLRASDVDGVGWAAPWRWPPPALDRRRTEQAEEWAWWALSSQGREGEAMTGTGPSQPDRMRGAEALKFSLCK